MTETTKLVMPTELFSEEPTVVARDPEKRATLVAYLREMRAKFIEDENSGARKRKKEPEAQRKTVDDILDATI